MAGKDFIQSKDKINKKTAFHNFKELSSEKSEDDLEDLAKRKRQDFLREIGIS